MLLALPRLDFISHSTGLSIFTVSIVVSLFLDMSINVTFNPARAIIADVTPPGLDRTKGFSWMQVVSGTFGIGAYFVSMAFGNMALIYTAALLVLLFSIVPVFLYKSQGSCMRNQWWLRKKNKDHHYVMVSISFFPCMVLLHSDYLWSSIK